MVKNASSRDSGITPAGAGKTFLALLYAAFKQDHPRRCGENFGIFLSLLTPLGSPPQVRGKHINGLRTDCYDGITPAGAGKT